MTAPLKRRQLTLVFETNEDLDIDILALPLAEFARRASEGTFTFELDDTTDAEFTESFLTHLIVRDLEGDDEKDAIPMKFNPFLLQEEEDEVVEEGPFHPAI